METGTRKGADAVTDEPRLSQEVTQDDLERHKQACSQALYCLHIAVEEIVANDVQAKILAYTSSLERALKAARAERDEAIVVKDNLCQQNTELLEDITAVRMERDEARATIRVLEDEIAKRNAIVTTRMTGRRGGPRERRVGP